MHAVRPAHAPRGEPHTPDARKPSKLPAITHTACRITDTHVPLFGTVWYLFVMLVLRMCLCVNCPGPITHDPEARKFAHFYRMKSDPTWAHVIPNGNRTNTALLKTRINKHPRPRFIPFRDNRTLMENPLTSTTDEVISNQDM